MYFQCQNRENAYNQDVTVNLIFDRSNFGKNKIMEKREMIVLLKKNFNIVKIALKKSRLKLFGNQILRKIYKNKNKKQVPVP